MHVRTRSLFAALAAAVSLFGAAGCGGESSTGGGADPATLAPANAALWIEGTIRPEGDQLDGFNAAAKKLLGVSDPGAKLRELFNKKAGGAGIKYETDIQPWLGKRAGIVVDDFTADTPSVVGIFASTDADKARAFIDKIAKGESGVHDAKYKDVTYKTDAELAAGVVGDFVVFGMPEANFKRAVDAKSGDSLADTEGFKKAVGGLPADRLGAFYFDTKKLINTALQQDPDTAAMLGQFQSLFDLNKLQPAAGALQANGDRVVIETVASTKGGSGSLLGPLSKLGSGDVALLGELPADSWAALGVPKLGESVKPLLATVKRFAGEAFFQQLEQQIGLNIERDVISWVGDVALFVRGATPAELNGALVIEATDEAAASKAVDKLIALATNAAGSGAGAREVKIPGATRALQIDQAQVGLPGALIVAIGNGRVALAIGEKAAADAIKSAQTLSGSDVFKGAGKAIGDYKPAFVLSVGQALALAEGAGASSDPQWAQIKQYLGALDVVASGGKVDGDRASTRIGVSLK